jgi:hypothetical protein
LLAVNLGLVVVMIATSCTDNASSYNWKLLSTCAAERKMKTKSIEYAKDVRDEKLGISSHYVVAYVMLVR